MPFEMQKDIMYFRLSEEDEEDKRESNSISSQRACVEQYLHDRPELGSNFEEIVDDGYSGTSLDRPGMRRLLAMIKRNQVRTVIVRDLSRFARNYLEAGYYLEIEFPSRGVRFISVNDGFDSEELGEDTGGLDLAIRNLVNQMYSHDISRKIKSVVDMKKYNGEYAFGAVPYGYKKGERHNTIVIDEPAAEIVRRIFSLATSGKSVSQIALTLNEDHVQTPSVYLADVRGRYKTRAFWTYDSVRNILGNRIYTGDTEVFKSHVMRVGSKRVRVIPEELRQVIPETHDAIISRSDYYLAHKVIKGVAPRKPTNGRRNPLSSYLVCGCCGNRLAKGKEANKTWLCSSARYTRDTSCEQVRMDDRKLQEVLLRAIWTQCELFDVKVKRLDEQKRKAGKDKVFFLQEIERCRKLMEQAEREKLKLYEQYAEGELSKEMFLSQKEEVSLNQNDIALQISLLQTRLEELKSLDGAAQNEIHLLREQTQYRGIAELTPAVMKELIRQIVIFPENRMRIEWNFRDEIAEQKSSEISMSSESA